MAENDPGHGDVTPQAQLNPGDVAPLADALDRLNLTGGQKALLSAIVAVAAHPPITAEDRIEVDARKKFHDQFAAAFTEGEIGQLDAKVSLIGRTVAT